MNSARQDMSNPLQWLAARNNKKRAWALAGPALKTIEEEIAAWNHEPMVREFPYLRNEKSSMVKDLCARAERIRKLAAWITAASEIARLENIINTGLKEVSRAHELLVNQQRLCQRIQSVDSEIKKFLTMAQGAPITVAKMHRNKMVRIRESRESLERAKHQGEFYLTLNELEKETKSHGAWLQEMETSAAELKMAMERFESLRMSSAWNANSAARENLVNAEGCLKAAESSRERANWKGARYHVQQAIHSVEAARIACDKSLSQAQEEIAMWRKFAAQSHDFSQMRATLESFHENIGQADLVRWLQFRSELELQIDKSVTQVMPLFRQLPHKVSPVPDWKESDLELHCKFANAVKDASEQVASLLRQRHQKRRRSRTTRSSGAGRQ